MRPNGWAEIKKYKADLNFSGALDAHFQPATENEAKYYLTGFETGADAYEEVLKKGGVAVNTMDCAVEYQGTVVVPKHSKGRLVFIEEEASA